MASDVDICNLSLSHISQGPLITGINPPDGTINAEHCAQYYPIARDIALELHAWKFATTRKILTPVVLPAAVTQWQFAYALPNQLIRPLAVLPPEAVDDAMQVQPYIIELDEATGQGRLLTNQEDAVLKYIVRQEDPTRFTPLFVITMSHLLAHFIAGPITKKAGVVEAQYKLFITQLKLASGSDAAGSYIRSYKDFTPSFLKARGFDADPQAWRR